MLPATWTTWMVLPLGANKWQSVCPVHYWELSVVIIDTWDLSNEIKQRLGRVYSPLLPLPFGMTQGYPKVDPKRRLGDRGCPLEPYLAMAYAQWLQVAACWSLRLDDHTLAWSMEALLEAMSGSFTLLRDEILNFLESDAHTEPVELQGPFKEIFPAFWDLFWDLGGGSNGMHPSDVPGADGLSSNCLLHDMPAGMLSRQEQMGELQLESFKGVAICSVKGASEWAIIGVLGFITGRSFYLHVHDWPMSDPMDTGCPSPGKALLPPAAPSTSLQHDSPIDIGLPLQIYQIPLSWFPSLHHQLLRRNRLSWMWPPICQSGKKQGISPTSSCRMILKRKKKTPKTFITSIGIPYDEMGILTWTVWRDTGGRRP